MVPLGPAWHPARALSKALLFGADRVWPLTWHARFVPARLAAVGIDVPEWHLITNSSAGSEANAHTTSLEANASIS